MYAAGKGRTTGKGHRAGEEAGERGLHGPIDQGLICICTKDGIYQGFKMDARKLDEYENKWFERVEKYEKLKATSEPPPQES